LLLRNVSRLSKNCISRMNISYPDIAGLLVGLAVWICAIIYFIRNPRIRSPADVDIDNIMGWGAEKSEKETDIIKDLDTQRFSVTKQFQQREVDPYPLLTFSESDSDAGYGVARRVSKRIDLDGLSVTNEPKKSKVDGQSVYRHGDVKRTPVSSQASSIHL